MIETEQHYTPSQAADLCGGVSDRTVRRWIEAGRRTSGRRGLWPVRRLTRKTILIPASSLNRMLGRLPA